MQTSQENQGEDEEALPKYVLKELLKTHQESEEKNGILGRVNKTQGTGALAARPACCLHQVDKTGL